MIVERYTGNVSLLLPVIRRWREEANKDFGFEMDELVHLQDLQSLIDGDGELFVLRDKEIVGYMGLTIFRSPLGRERIANEHFWYVIPEARGTSSIRLIKEAHKWAREKDCQYLMMTASEMASDMHDTVCKIYERLGMRRFETTFIRKVI